VKFFCDTFKGRFVAEILELGTFHHVGRNAHEGASSILIRYGVVRQNRCITRPECTPRVVIHSPAARNPACLLKRLDGLAHVLTEAAVDFSRREPRAIEQHLGPHHGSAVHTSA
jgi:hypothetical protein